MTKRIETITKTLDKLTLNELNELSRELASRLGTKELEDEDQHPDSYESTKALDVSFGGITGYSGVDNRITLAQFQQKLDNLVSDCVLAQASKNDLVKGVEGKTRYSHYGGMAHVKGKSKKQVASTAEDAFGPYNGEYVISIGGKVKIYALHKKTNTKEAAKRKTQREIAKLTATLESKKRARRKAEKDAKALKNVVAETAETEQHLLKKIKLLKSNT